MKQMTCAQMGGPKDCNTAISGNSEEEMINNGMAHLKKEHPKMAEDMKTMPKGTMDAWRADFNKKFAAIADK